MKKSKLARKLQEAKRSKRRVLKENYSPKVAKVNNELKKFINKDTTFVPNSIRELGGGFTKGVSIYVNPKDDVNDLLMDGTNVHVHQSDGTFYDQPAGTWVIGVESPSEQVGEFVSEAEAKEFFDIISPLLKNAGAKLIVNDKDTNQPFTDLFKGESKAQPKSDNRTLVYVTGLDEFGADDFGLTDEEFDNVLGHDGEEGYIELGGEEFDKYDYHTVTFNDGFVLPDLSGYHIEPIDGDLEVTNLDEAKKEGTPDLDALLTEGKKARGRFPKKKRAIRGKRKLTEGSLPKKDSLAVVWMWKDSNGTMNHDMYHALNDNAAAQEVKDIKSNRCYDKTKDIIKIMPLAKYENKFNDDNDIITESKKKDIHFDMSQNLVESINSFLTEDEDEETFFSNPDQEDAFGKSGRDDKPRSGKEFQEKSIENYIGELIELLKRSTPHREGVKKTLRDYIEEEVDNNEVLAQAFVSDSDIDTSKLASETRGNLINNIDNWLWDGGVVWIVDTLLYEMFDDSATDDEKNTKFAKMVDLIKAGKFDQILDDGNISTAMLEFVPDKAHLDGEGFITYVQDAPSNRPTNSKESNDFVERANRFERVLARMNGIGVDSNGALNVDLSDYDISGFSEAIETASDSLSDLLDYLDI